MVESVVPYPGSPEGPTKHFWFLLTRLEQRRPFLLIRFSDGELEILKNEKLEMSDNKIVWSKGQVNFSYPEYDFKSFLRKENAEVRDLLVKSACYSAANFFKGIPTAHNRVPVDTALMKKLSSSEDNLTFVDIGTTLQPLTGMPPSRRSYLAQMEPWTPSAFVPKLKYLFSPRRRLKW